MNIIYKKQDNELLFENISLEPDPLSRKYDITNENNDTIGTAEGYCNKYGELICVIKIFNPAFQKSGIGFGAFKKIYNELDSIIPIVTIIGSWHRDGEFQDFKDGMSTNMKIFIEENEKNPNKEEIAFLTPTGKWAKKLGYTKCEIKQNSTESILVYFMKE